MTEHSKHLRLVNDTIAAARKIAAADPHVLAGSYTDFLRVMWTDNHDMLGRGMNYQSYEGALYQAWEQLKRST